MTTILYKEGENQMKNNKKRRGVCVLFVLILSFTTLLLPSVSAYASSDAFDGNTDKAEEYYSDTGGIEDGYSVSANKNKAVNDAGNGDNSNTEEDFAGGNVFAELYALFVKYIGEIMCALTLAGSLILTLLYKRGLMPFMSRTVGAIGSTIAGIKASTDDYAKKSCNDMNEIKSALDTAATATEGLAKRLGAMENALENAATSKSDGELFRAAIECQSSLLYDILMSSSIPQYQKDAVGEKLGEIKKRLAETGARSK